MILLTTNSPKKNKKLRAFINDGQYIDFGLKDSKTYIDHKNIELRENYRKRHLGNKIENHLIKNLILSPSLLSYYILWGPHTNINDNIKYLNNLLKSK
jgi:hypothetical protein